MATRSNIVICVKPEDFDRVNEYLADNVNNPDSIVSEKTPYLQIYCHYDGYISGVGYKLRNEYNTYDAALKLILRGSCSEPGRSYVSQGESYEDNYPLILDKPEPNQNYLYIFEDDKWTVEYTRELNPEYDYDKDLIIKIEKYNSEE